MRLLTTVAASADYHPPRVVVPSLLALLADPHADESDEAASTLALQLQRTDIQQYLCTDLAQLRLTLSLLAGVHGARLPLLQALQVVLQPPSELARALVAEGALPTLAALLYEADVGVVTAALLCMLNVTADHSASVSGAAGLLPALVRVARVSM